MVVAVAQSSLGGAIPYARMGVFNVYVHPNCLIWWNRYHPTRTLWGDQCLDAVTCKGSRLIRPTWMLCLELLNVDWALIGPARDAAGYCTT